MNKWGITEEQAAKVTVKNRSNAVHNEKAHLRSKVKMDEVLQSGYVSSPLRKLNLPPHSDGACAIVLTTEEKAKKSGRPIAWIKGIGWANDTYYMGDKNLWRLSSLAAAAKRAYAMSGIQNPLKEIDVAEVYDVTSFHELMEYEALGFCKEGDGGKLIDSGATSIDGELPVNPSGGMLSSNPYTAVGLFRVAEAALQVSGQAEGRQVPGAKVALAHGMSGICGQSNCVVILSN
jgi:acetyl-CoA C-acetyltransferase